MKRMLSIAICICLLVALFPTAVFGATTGNISSFKDVSASQWYASYIEYVTEKGLMVGTSATAFSPEMAVTRAQYVQVLYAMAGKPEASKETKFTDLKKGAFYEKAVSWAAANGVTEGITKTTFGPDRKVTREQAATFFKAYAEKIAKITTTEAAALNVFPDTASASNYAVKSLQWAVGAKLISGVKSGSKVLLLPKGTLTRAQLATMLKAFDEFLSNKKSEEGEKASQESDQNSPANPADSQNNPSENNSNGKDTPTPSKQDSSTEKSISTEELQTLESLGKIDIYYNNEGKIRAIDGEFSDRKVKNESDAAAFLKDCSDFISDDLQPESSQIGKQVVENDDIGEEIYYRYFPVINGISVIGNEIILMTDSDGTVTSLFSTYDIDSEDLDTNPTISKKQAEQIAIDDLSPELGESKTVTSLFDVESDLAICNEDDGSHSLCYQVCFVNKTSSDSKETEDSNLSDDEEPTIPAVYMQYYIYANGPNKGTIKHKTDGFQSLNSTEELKANDMLGKEQTLQLPMNMSRTQYIFKNSDYRIRIYESYYNEEDDSWSNGSQYSAEENTVDSRAVSLLKNIEKAYEAYHNIGFDLKYYMFLGEPITATFNYFHPEHAHNAGWVTGGQRFMFSLDDYYESSLDAVAHEFTHAVINRIIYESSVASALEELQVGQIFNYTCTLGTGGAKEASALNESLADIMGSLIEGKTDTNRWTMAEDRGRLLSEHEKEITDDPLFSQLQAEFSGIRDMSEKRTYDELDLDESEHYNARIFNYAAYKMMSDSRTSNISNVEWEKIFYNSFYKLASDATFLDARNAVLISAEHLSRSSSEILAIKEGFSAAKIYPFSVDDDETPPQDEPSAASEIISFTDSAVVLADHSLWMWGTDPLVKAIHNGPDEPQLRDRPEKVMTDVLKIVSNSHMNAVIKTDGSLWVWGENPWGTLGIGKPQDAILDKDSDEPYVLKVPTKILEDVEDVSLGNQISAAVQKDGSLWVWGACDFPAEVTLDFPDYILSPKKILGNVKQVFLHPDASNQIYALNRDGALWGWGYNTNGEVLGKNKPNIVQAPELLAGDIKKMYCVGTTQFILKKDGTLYARGGSSGNQNITGTGARTKRTDEGSSTFSYSEEKVMSDVKSIHFYDDSVCAVIKNDDSLWMWGNNKYNIISPENESWISIPTKVMDNVADIKISQLNYFYVLRTNGSFEGYSQASRCSQKIYYADGELIKEHLVGSEWVKK